MVENLGLQYKDMGGGLFEIQDDITSGQQDQLKMNLPDPGWDLLINKKHILTQKIKCLVIDMVYQPNLAPNENYSVYFSAKLGYDYTYMANTFSAITGVCIRQFIILHKIERVKQLLLHNEFNLQQISSHLQYSSVAHLSNQFKKITGWSPGSYRRLQQQRQLHSENV